MTVHEKAELIIKDIKLEEGVNPTHIFRRIAQKEYVSMVLCQDLAQNKMRSSAS